MSRKETSVIAMGGICLALTVAFLFGAAFVPGVELTLYALSSVFTAVMVLEKGPRSGIVLYVAAVILGLLLVPNKLGMLPYIIFFGYYGVVKFYFEKIRNPIGQICLKVLFFAGIIAVVIWGVRHLILGVIQIPDYPQIVLFTSGIALLLVYDVLLTLFIRLYRERIQREKMPEFKLEKED